MIPRPYLFVILAAGVLAAAISLAAGCATDRVTAPQPDPDRATEPVPRLRAYLSPDDPVNVVANLETAYANRDIDAYAGLFAPEFRFKFQPQDARRTGRESWGLEEDLRSTRNMFYSAKVKSIEIRLRKQPAVPATESGLQHTMLVVVSPMFLRITERSGRVMEVNGDRQEFYLRRAYDEDGAERWLIVEWRDLPGS
jgi:hypothetical protein